MGPAGGRLGARGAAVEGCAVRGEMLCVLVGGWDAGHEAELAVWVVLAGVVEGFQVGHAVEEWGIFVGGGGGGHGWVEAAWWLWMLLTRFSGLHVTMYSSVFAWPSWVQLC